MWLRCGTCSAPRGGHSPGRPGPALAGGTPAAGRPRLDDSCPSMTGSETDAHYAPHPAG